MSVTLEETPYPLDFAGNNAAFKFRGTPYTSNGRKAVSTFQVNQMPALGYRMFVNYGDETLSLTVTTAYNKRDDPGFLMRRTTTASIREELQRKIANNYDILQLYDVTVSATLAIVFTSKEYGGSCVNISTNDPNASIVETGQITGIERGRRNGYRFVGWLETEYYRNGAVVTGRSPEITLIPDENGQAKLPVRMLRSLFEECDIPTIGEPLAAYALQNALIRYRFTYADCFATDSALQVQSMSSTEYFLLSAGMLNEPARALNLPDWECPMGATQKLSHYPHIRNYGSPSGLTVQSFREMPQYAYFLLFDRSSGSTYSRTMNVHINAMATDGTATALGAFSVGVQNFNIVRIPLSANALNLPDDVFVYTVSISEVGMADVWSRRFVIKQKPFFAKVFLLQNRYGVLESFFTESEMTEKEMKGDEVVRDDGFEIAVTEDATTFTARTGSKTKEELQLLADAMVNALNYRLEGDSPQAITILPDTLTIFDEAEDLQSAEFQYRLNEPQNDAGEAVGGGGLVSADDYWNDLDAMEHEVIWNDLVRFNPAAAVNELAIL